MKHLIQVLVNSSDKIGFFSWFALCKRDKHVFYVFIQLMDSNVKQTKTKNTNQHALDFFIACCESMI